MENINTLVIHQKLKSGLPYYPEIQFLDKDKFKKKQTNKQTETRD